MTKETRAYYRYLNALNRWLSMLKNAKTPNKTKTKALKAIYRNYRAWRKLRKG